MMSATQPSDFIRFPACETGLRVTHNSGETGAVIDYARSLSQTNIVPVIWDQPGPHPTHVLASSLAAFGGIRFEEVYWTFSQRAEIYLRVLELLRRGETETAKELYETGCFDWWDKVDFMKRYLKGRKDLGARIEAAQEVQRLRLAEEERINAQRRADDERGKQIANRARIEELLRAGSFEAADAEYREQCLGYWSQDDYSKVRSLCEQEYEARQHRLHLDRQKRERERNRVEVSRLLQTSKFEEADEFFDEHCVSWWEKSAYIDERADYVKASRLADAIVTGSLQEVAELHQKSPNLLSASEVASLSHDKVLLVSARVGVRLDREQVIACAQPTRRRLIRARAGSGKTRTLAAFAAMAINDEDLDPDQVLILAFNKQAATEIGDRVRKAAGVPQYRNARTFHSLAHRLAGFTGRKLIFDDGSLQLSRRMQSRQVERVVGRILNPAFRLKLYEFFRREIEQIDEIGSNLSEAEYVVFRRAMSQFTLGGENVKSNGEKFIADFLFEHGIPYVYERVFSWKAEDRLNGSPYQPDFCIDVDGKDLILEHWGIDPANPNAEVPSWWETSTGEYRQQIIAKREFWKARGMTLLETHAGMLSQGREEFEAQLLALLRSTGVHPRKLDDDELTKRVAEAPRAISRMASLFRDFISRAKKRGWTVEEAAQRIASKPDPESRNRVFHELAVRAFAEYERALLEPPVPEMDFDDLLIEATNQVRKHGSKAMLGLDNRDAIALSELRWILIDEFQDFSELYNRLLEAILEANPQIRVVAVGDDWQAINGFAGAQLSFFNNFDGYFNGATTAAITTNYRSGRSIVGAGNTVMTGCGQPAMACKSVNGKVQVCAVDKVWVDGANSEIDALCLNVTQDLVSGKPKYTTAKALKACVDFVVESAFVQDGILWLRKVLVLSRSGFAYGIRLSEFEDALIAVLKHHPDLASLVCAIDLEVMTAHASKGKEADTVIILEATNKQFPKVHADNQLFAPFDVSIEDTLAEERRLFYVAITRAEHRLLLLTATGQVSSMVEELHLANGTNHILSSVPNQVGAVEATSDLARFIQNRLDQIGRIELIRNNISSAAVPLLDQMLAKGVGLPEVPHFLSGDICAELAWPQAQPPVAVLTGQHRTHSDEWKSKGWSVHEAPALTGAQRKAAQTDRNVSQ